MRYGLEKKIRTAFTFLCLCVVCETVMASDALRFNPFEKPDMHSGLSQMNAINGTGNQLRLRGTVLDGNDSMANISGEFYRLNEEVSGYRISRIESGKVTLRRGENKTVLALDDE